MTDPWQLEDTGWPHATHASSRHSDGTPLLVIADAAPGAGLGHLVRSSAVVTALGLRGMRVTPLGLGGEGTITVDGVDWPPATLSQIDQVASTSEVLLLDTYTDVSESRLLQSPVACFFDPGRPPPSDARLVIAPPVDSSEPGWLCGLRFACLRPSYWGGAVARVSERIERILVTTGGTDPGEISDELLDAAREAAPGAELRRVRARGASVRRDGVVELEPLPNLREELRAADLILCLGGQTALEAACLGVPVIAVAAVANQLQNVERLAALGAAEGLRRDGPVVPSIRALAIDAGRRRALSAAGQAAVDGFGALRVAAAIDSVLGA